MLYDKDMSLVMYGLLGKVMCQIMYICIHMFIFYDESGLVCGGAGIDPLRVISVDTSLVSVTYWKG